MCVQSASREGYSRADTHSAIEARVIARMLRAAGSNTMRRSLRADGCGERSRATPAICTILAEATFFVLRAVAAVIARAVSAESAAVAAVGLRPMGIATVILRTPYVHRSERCVYLRRPVGCRGSALCAAYTIGAQRAFVVCASRSAVVTCALCAQRSRIV